MVRMIEENPPAQPWDRFGWVMSVIWLVFLAFPVAASLQQGWLRRVVGLTAIGAFALVYVYSFVIYPRRGTSPRVRTLTLAGLVGLMLVLATAIGAEALALMPFLVAFTVFHQPFRRALALSLLGLFVLVAVLTATASWPVLWMLVPIVVLVGVATGATRWIEIRQESHVALHDELQRAAERERMARDVHDVLGHSLTVITIKSELARRLIDVDPAQAAAEIGEVEELSREALNEIRATVSGKRTPRLEEELERAAAALASAGISYSPPEDPQVLAGEHRVVAAWVLREAVTNVIRHSRAVQCTVELGASRLAVSDDGVGTGDPHGPAGTGLRGIRERVEASGGSLRLTSEPGSGTRVEVAW